MTVANKPKLKSVTDSAILASDLPEGWDSARLGRISTIVTGRKDVNEENPDGKYPFFTCARKIHRIDEYSFEGEAVLIAGNGFFNVKNNKIIHTPIPRNFDKIGIMSLSSINI